MSFSLVIHGGAGNITPSMMNAEQETQYRLGLQNALNAGTAVLAGGGTAIDAIVAAITSMEDNPLFNAGRGAVFTKKGLHEMDAAIMNGLTLEAGAVAGVRNVKNPVTLAREIMLHSGHVFLSGNGAAEFALKQGIEMAHDDYFFNKDRHDQWMAIRDSDMYQLDHKEDNLKGASTPAAPTNVGHKFGTVGAVAYDAHGNIAASTSTGGMTNKRFGRIGDSPVIGAGTYANNKTCAISCTGHGELFLRAVVAYDVSCLMDYKGFTLQQAADTVMNEKLRALGGEGGLIGVDAKGTHCFSFNSAGMYRGYRNSEGGGEVAFYGK